jgi:TIR domain
VSKPTIFFSHSSKDKDVLARLKDMFVDKTGGTIAVFLSSDGQSIPLGRNWVHRVQESLNEAALMVVFITPNSLRSNWIYFEAGYAYSKDIKVVPVGFLGIDLSSVRPPLSLLQGFNISNHDGLDNLIAMTNDEFSHKHKSRFSDSEYKELVFQDEAHAPHPLGEFLHFIDEYSGLVCQDQN